MDFDPFAEGRTKVLAALAGDELSEHDAHQAQLLSRAFINTDAREAAGCEPVRKVIDDIRSISNIGELTDFLLDTERSAGVPTLIQVKNKQDYDEHRWVTRIDLSPWTFGSTMETMGMNAETVDPESSVYRARHDLVYNILTRIGYTDEEAEKAFEGRLRLEKEIIRVAEETKTGQDKSLTLTIGQLDDRLWTLPSLIEGGGSFDAFSNSFLVDASVVEGESSRYEAGKITLEELLGGNTGYIIFHEIGHALDTENIYLDAKGEYVGESLLTGSDLEEYERRAGRIETYFDSISIWEGQQVYGTICMNEALAEICSMQARLAYAAKQENFDYRTFFEARARIAPTLHTPEYELAYIMGLDMHPSAYLDTNVTVQQFEAFMNAYGVKEGDAMYLAPEERLVFWQTSSHIMQSLNLWRQAC